MRNGVCSRRPTAERRTFGSESGFWQTPVADDAVDRKAGKWNSRGEPKLSAQVMLPTPSASNREARPAATWNPKSQSGRSLGCMAKTGMWPTPTSCDYKDGTAKSCENVPVNGLLGRAVHYPTTRACEWKANAYQGNKDKPRLTLTGVARQESSGRTDAAGGKLAPAFVEWLMVFPIGWSDCARSATRRFRQWLRRHSAS
jgi:hypothetical protein